MKVDGIDGDSTLAGRLRSVAAGKTKLAIDGWCWCLFGCALIGVFVLCRLSGESVSVGATVSASAAGDTEKKDGVTPLKEEESDEVGGGTGELKSNSISVILESCNDCDETDIGMGRHVSCIPISIPMPDVVVANVLSFDPTLDILLLLSADGCDGDAVDDGVGCEGRPSTLTIPTALSPVTLHGVLGGFGRGDVERSSAPRPRSRSTRRIDLPLFGDE